MNVSCPSTEEIAHCACSTTDSRGDRAVISFSWADVPQMTVSLSKCKRTMYDTVQGSLGSIVFVLGGFSGKKKNIDEYYILMVTNTGT